MRKTIKYAAAITAALFLLSLIPLILLAPYITPSADDFGYGAPAYYALQTGAGFSGVIKALAENLRYTYMNWQGTYSSVILFSLQPGVFDGRLYIITPFVMLAAVVVPIFLVLNSVRGMSRSGKILIGSVTALLSVQFLPSVAEGIFWWNGGAHYMIFWCLSVLAVVLQITNKDPKIIAAAAQFLLAFFVTGGNYLTSLTYCLTSFVVTAYRAFSRDEKQAVVKSALITLSAAVGLIISMAAPGNAVRQAAFDTLPPLTAVISALCHAASDIARYTDAAIIGAIILCVAAFVFSRNGQRIYRLNPIIVLAVSFGLFASLYVPPLYAMNDCDIPRIKNLFYLAYIFFMFGNSLYAADYISGRLKNIKSRKGLKQIICAAGAVMFIVSLIFQASHTNFTLAYNDLQGDAQKYRAEVEERERIYSDKSILPPRFTDISVPACFHGNMFLTWNTDVILNGAPSDLLCIHSCACDVTYVPVEQAVRIFDCVGKVRCEDFSKTFDIGGELCVPIRELADKIGIEMIYIPECDTLEFVKPN